MLGRVHEASGRSGSCLERIKEFRTPEVPNPPRTKKKVHGYESNELQHPLGLRSAGWALTADCACMLAPSEAPTPPNTFANLPPRPFSREGWSKEESAECCSRLQLQL